MASYDPPEVPTNLSDAELLAWALAKLDVHRGRERYAMQEYDDWTTYAATCTGRDLALAMPSVRGAEWVLGRQRDIIRDLEQLIENLTTKALRSGEAPQ